MMQLSTISASGFDEMLQLFDHVLVKLICSGLIWSVAHHFFAGIRFLFIDFDIGVGKRIANRTAWLVFLLEAVVTLCLLCWVWS